MGLWVLQRAFNPIFMHVIAFLHVLILAIFLLRHTRNGRQSGFKPHQEPEDTQFKRSSHSSYLLLNCECVNDSTALIHGQPEKIEYDKLHKQLKKMKKHAGTRHLTVQNFPQNVILKTQTPRYLIYLQVLSCRGLSVL